MYLGTWKPQLEHQTSESWIISMFPSSHLTFLMILFRIHICPTRSTLLRCIVMIPYFYIWPRYYWLVYLVAIGRRGRKVNIVPPRNNLTSRASRLFWIAFESGNPADETGVNLWALLPFCAKRREIDMAQLNPDLQEKLDELERELEVRWCYLLLPLFGSRYPYRPPAAAGYEAQHVHKRSHWTQTNYESWYRKATLQRRGKVLSLIL